MPKLLDKCIVTGCDEKTEWQLPWFLENYYSWNTIPLLVADFGMTQQMKDYTRTTPIKGLLEKNATLDFNKGWFFKPITMYSTPAKEAFWIDTDCEILGNLEFMFRYIKPNKLCMAIDRPWLKRRKEEWYNSGVVGWGGKPDILRMWAEQTKARPNVGDQEVLHEMLNPITRMTYITELPNEYNWLRLQIEHDNEDSSKKKIMHWTGEKGNDRIRGKMKIKEAMRA